MPADWIKKKLAEAAVRPSNDELLKSKENHDLHRNVTQKIRILLN